MRWVKKSTDYAVGGVSFLHIGGIVLYSVWFGLLKGGAGLTIVTSSIFAGFGAVLVVIGARWFRLSLGFYRSERIEAGLPPSLR